MHVRYRYLKIPFSPPAYYGQPVWDIVLEENPNDPDGAAQKLKEMGYTLIIAPKEIDIIGKVKAKKIKTWPDTILYRID